MNFEATESMFLLQTRGSRYSERFQATWQKKMDINIILVINAYYICVSIALIHTLGFDACDCVNSQEDIVRASQPNLPGG